MYAKLIEEGINEEKLNQFFDYVTIEVTKHEQPTPFMLATFDSNGNELREVFEFMIKEDVSYFYVYASRISSDFHSSMSNHSFGHLKHPVEAVEHITHPFPSHIPHTKSRNDIRFFEKVCSNPLRSVVTCEYFLGMTRHSRKSVSIYY
jgi:hypothetical protein